MKAVKNIKIVIGSNFGDEGKGITTDFFCSKFPKDEFVLNVRFNGGSQAGHTVVTKDGKRHVFHNFGAGSFNENVITYLSSYSFVEPMSFIKEREELRKLGVRPRVQMDHSLNIVIPYDIFFNHMIEISRGKDRHGSCGYGIWECLKRSEYKKLSPLTFRYRTEKELKEKIFDIRDNYYMPKIKELGIEIPVDYKELWESENLIDKFIYDVKNMLLDIQFVPEHEIFKEYNNFVFEGAQGLLLDWGNREYMPHLTASYTGLKNVEEILRHLDEPYKKEICYVTRTYMTRHGAGRFETETDKVNLRYEVNDKTNVYNPWQQNFRWGYFDLPLFLKTVEKDLGYNTKKNATISLSVTHLDETNNCFVLPDRDMPVEEIKEHFKFKRILKFSNEITK